MDYDISVIVPVKNGESRIENCLKSIFNQTFAPLEVLIVDGHSTDKTVDIAKKFPVKIVYEDYQTVGGARKVGVEHSRGYYVAFTDADCIPKQDWLENLVNKFDDNIVGVGGAIVNIGDGIWAKSIAFALDSFLGSANSVQDRVFNHQKYVNSISGCNSSYRRSDLIKIGNYNPNLAFNEDTELNKRLLNLGSILYTPDAAIYHKQDRGLKDFSKRIFLFGKARAINKLFDLQVVPPILAIITFVLIFMSLKAFILMIALYSCILLAFNFKIFFKHQRLVYLFSVPVIFILEHLFYTLGFWRGVLEIIGGSK